jgi:3-deoxy-D-manno-octulosonic-acid transferase
MLQYYKFFTYLASPLVPLWLRFRSLRGKEDPGRLKERFGHSSYARPKGILLWIHAASVGEANSVLGLIHQLRKQFPNLGILLTTGTVTSAALMKQHLPDGVLHHYAPVDTPEATQRFMRHWAPDVVWFVESELWPNLIDAAKSYYCLMALINARMSERSFYFWQKYPNVAREMLSSFRLTFAQSEADAARLRALGAKEVLTSGNLKYDAPPLSCNEGELFSLKQLTEGRPLWLAASTHPGEEMMAAKAHQALRKTQPGLLTIIVPRHPGRGAEIARSLGSYGSVALRSRKENITSTTDFYIADTLGELGLFYRLCEIVFMGGSLVVHGGQNPLEPAQLACAILSGPHTTNFRDMYQQLQAAKAALLIHEPQQLAAAINNLLAKPTVRSDMQHNAKQFTQERAGSSQMIIETFAPVFAQ